MTLTTSRLLIWFEWLHLYIMCKVHWPHPDYRCGLNGCISVYIMCKVYWPHPDYRCGLNGCIYIMCKVYCYFLSCSWEHIWRFTFSDNTWHHSHANVFIPWSTSYRAHGYIESTRPGLSSTSPLCKRIKNKI